MLLHLLFDGELEGPGDSTRYIAVLLAFAAGYGVIASQQPVFARPRALQRHPPHRLARLVRVTCYTDASFRSGRRIGAASVPGA